GGGNDTLLGGAGFDLLSGDAGNDVLRSRDLPGKRGLRDRRRHESVDGGSGKDRAQVDKADKVKRVEKRLK
ncbi:MAG: hypothetical protein JWN41_604, partial [Thermoleophilia bacterium]|nr:hypothetical protein [Thermoleophilia bacterium]